MKTAATKPLRRARLPAPLRSLTVSRNGHAIRLGKILVPIDFSVESKKALHYAAQFAQQFGATISLLHVVEPITFPTDYGYGPVVRQIPNKEGIKRAKTKLNRIGQKEIGAPWLADAVVRSGIAFFAITEAAKAMEADLIIMGTHGYSDISPTFATGGCLEA
jgi:nucleotide-binding universal stress UspA family protein